MPEPVNAGRLLVTAAASGRTLLEFLAEELGLSKRQAKAALDRRDVFVNGRRVWMARHQLHAGDRVDIAAPAPGPVAREAPGSGHRILFRDEHLIVADKPAGILACGPGSLELELQSDLHLPGLSAVHRLDRDTTGCLMFAISGKALDEMVLLFRHRRVDKRYHVLVEGMVREKFRTIDQPIAGEHSVTHLELLSGNRRASHLLVRIETGRTHQIRRHLIAIGYRVLGDRTYGAGREVGADYRGVPRQMLHAASLRFVHPLSGREVRVTAPLPADFTKCMTHYGLK
ncbi:MAG: RluA family pseudouridine synthase [bacterium]